MLLMATDCNTTESVEYTLHQQVKDTAYRNRWNMLKSEADHLIKVNHVTMPLQIM